METTIIKLQGGSNENMVVRSTTFEEAFGDFSEARGKGRARRKKRKLERIGNRRDVKTERRKLKGDRQEERIGRRATRKQARQQMRDQQQASRMGRRGERLDMRQRREEGRQMRRDTRTQGEQGRENYVAEQENYREGLENEGQENGATSTQQGGDDSTQDWGSAPNDNSSAPQGGGGYNSSEDWNTPPNDYNEDDYAEGEDSQEGAYGDDNTYEGDYVQEEDEFNDDSYFNIEGMDGKSVVSPYVKETAQKLKNNAKAYKVLSLKRENALANQDKTEGLENLLNRTRTRIIELKSNLDDYCNADGNPNERKRRKKEVNLALGRRLRKRQRVGQYAGSEVPVDSDLNPEFTKNRIVVPSTSNFDAYSDLGRPVIINGETMSDENDYTNDIYGDFEPTIIEMQSSADGGSSKNNTLMSVAIGVGVGALALYLAKRKGWI